MSFSFSGPHWSHVLVKLGLKSFTVINGLYLGVAQMESSFFQPEGHNPFRGSHIPMVGGARGKSEWCNECRSTVQGDIIASKGPEKGGAWGKVVV